MVNVLDPAQLQKLFVRLGLQKLDTDKARYRGGKKVSDLQVLHQWREMRGPEATKEHILEALEKCGNMEARDKLSVEWMGMW